MRGMSFGIFKGINYPKQEKGVDKKINFEERVNKAYENPYTLEYAEAVKKAKELLNKGLTSGKLLRRGEDAAKELCGPEIIDVAVVIGAVKKLEELKKVENRKKEN